jgi:predicted dehydrogenase
MNLAITGCGHRGDFVGSLFVKHTNTEVVALHDYFEDRVNTLGDKLKVDPKRRFTGLDGYHQLLEKDVDVVAVMSPPYFHPDQSVTTLEAGKHLYLSKPIAVDVPGCKKILKAAGKVGKDRRILVDFQTRNDPLFREAATRVHAGDIGQPVLGHVYYQAPRLQQHDKGSGETARLRNWVFDKRLSGDIIVEQNVHVIDVANWYLQATPIRALGTGGRKARTDVGDTWDHSIVTFWYPNDVVVDFSSGQYLKGYDDLCIRVYGSNGTVDSHYSGPVSITGDHPWPGGTTEGLYSSGTVNNIKDYYEAVVNGAPLYETLENSVNTILSGILARTAAYEGRAVTWDEMYKSKEVIDPGLKLPVDGPKRLPV